ncbi:MAG: NUDIX hydrolase [Chloroflexi bacterium]|nr:NUDIX hydrolase [Chloroflexota bacterium]
MGDPPAVVASKRVHEGYLGLRVDTVRYASGREGTIDLIEHPGGVTIVPVDADGLLLMVRQYRHPCARPLLELPAGTLDPPEAPEACAERELQEETGYRPRRLERLGGFFTAPGYCNEYLHVFLATELEEGTLEGDEEAIAVERVSLDEALRLAATGGIEDAKTLAALLCYLQRR